MPSNRAYFDALGARASETRNARTAAKAEALRRLESVMIEAGAAGLPVNLRALASHLRVDAIRQTRLGPRGRVVIEGSSVVIEVSERLSAFEQRYTLAHELAHVLLEDRMLATRVATGAHDYARTRAHFDEMESLCDACADEILAPARWIRGQTRERIVSIDVAIALANAAECPVDFILSRIVTLAVWECWLVWWKRRLGEVLPLRTEPNRGQAFVLSIAPTPRTAASIVRCFEYEYQVVAHEIELIIGDERQRYRGQSIRTEADIAVSLLPYER